MFDVNDFLAYAGAGTVKNTTVSRKAIRNNSPRHPLPVSNPLPNNSFTSPSFAISKKEPVPIKPVLELFIYSERSFAIFGDTKLVKDQLDQLYGKFNRFLRKDGVVTPGYIFSIGRIDAVRKALNL